jgi:hypothetical protein
MSECNIIPGKFESFRKLVSSLTACALPMLSVFVILAILIAICERYVVIIFLFSM